MKAEHHTTIVDAAAIASRVEDDDWAIVDARYDLRDQEAGRAAYARGHIPGAQYVHLHHDLSGPPITDRGRHPLPSPQALTALFARLGIDEGVQVVVYDQADGATAARMWWLLRYMGHESVAVLDGGWKAWEAGGYPASNEPGVRAPRVFKGKPRSEWLVTLDTLAACELLVDSRDPSRYRGESEPLDPKAGHIPGALNHFYRDNLDRGSRFLPPERLREKLLLVMGEVPSTNAVFYCGSGVTACHNLLALAHAGLSPAKLYAGSWSEWCRDPARAIATGSGS